MISVLGAASTEIFSLSRKEVFMAESVFMAEEAFVAEVVFIADSMFMVESVIMAGSAVSEDCLPWIELSVILDDVGWLTLG